MKVIELPGGTMRIDTQTWSGPVIPAMTEALLADDSDGAFAAYSAWLVASGAEVVIAIFPISDAEALIAAGRPNLAKLLGAYGLLSDTPTVIR